MTAAHWTCMAAAMVGGAFAGALGLTWIDAPPPNSTWSIVASSDAGYALLLALALACAGGVLVHRRLHQAGSGVLMFAGVFPGLLEPRAFVGTFLLVFAGVIASSLPKRVDPR